MKPFVPRPAARRLLGAVGLAVVGVAAWQLTLARQGSEPARLAPDIPAFLKEYQAAPRVMVPVSTGGALVLIVKFTDYQCPGCAATHRLYKPVLDKYQAAFPGAVKLVTRDFPWNTECNAGAGRTLHPAACEAAVAAFLAAEQKHGAKMEDWLYANQQMLTPEMVRRAAEVVGNVRDFAAGHARAVERIKADAALGKLLGVDSTPTLFINGVKQPGIQPELLDAAIGFELRKAGKIQ